MTISSWQYTVTTNAQCVFGPDEDGAHVNVRVMGSVMVYFGGMGVTSEDGLGVENDDGVIVLFLGPGECLYAICEEDTSKIGVLASLNE